MKTTFPSWKSFEYVQVFEILERRGGDIYKTRPKGFARKDRPKQKDEMYTSLSTSMTKNETITLDLLE